MTFEYFLSRRAPPGNDQDIDEKRTGSRVLVDGCTSRQMLRVKHATGVCEYLDVSGGAPAPNLPTPTKLNVIHPSLETSKHVRSCECDGLSAGLLSVAADPDWPCLV